MNIYYPEARVVTAAIDNIFIRHAADVTRDLVCRARINYVGRSSLEVGIRVEQPGPEPLHIASCYFTMVARSGMGEEAVSVALPPLDYMDDTEKRRFDKAVARREGYKQSQAALLEPPSHDEYQLLAALHTAQEAPGFQGLLAGRLVTDAWERMYPGTGKRAPEDLRWLPHKAGLRTFRHLLGTGGSGAFHDRRRESH
ncbi:MAG: acyl-CoA thioesterase [Desulfuromonadaceae bacterium]